MVLGHLIYPLHKDGPPPTRKSQHQRHDPRKIWTLEESDKYEPPKTMDCLLFFFRNASKFAFAENCQLFMLVSNTSVIIAIILLDHGSEPIFIVVQSPL